MDSVRGWVEGFLVERVTKAVFVLLADDDARHPRPRTTPTASRALTATTIAGALTGFIALVTLAAVVPPALSAVSGGILVLLALAFGTGGAVAGGRAARTPWLWALHTGEERR
jgi:hypothetical protein